MQRLVLICEATDIYMLLVYVCEICYTLKSLLSLLSRWFLFNNLHRLDVFFFSPFSLFFYVYTLKYLCA